MDSPRPGQPKSCKKRYPREFRERTAVEDDGYPLYRRRDNGQRVTKQVRGREVTLDNRYVVPYNPFLSRKYNAHVNVELCATIRAIKYVNKYVYKGSDQITAKITRTTTTDVEGEDPVRNEVQEYLESRYISPIEACWRIFEFATNEQFPAVYQLAVHLEGQDSVDFPGDISREELQEKLDQETSTLTAFFKYNAEHTDGREILYSDFPAHYVYQEKEKPRRWTPRQKGFAIGRMWFVNHREGERFYLRLLLTSVPGPTSFEDLRTVNGVVHPTFKSACQALGLLEDDKYWISCFEEASVWATGKQLRDLFVSTLTYGDVIDVCDLWNRFRESLCDDLQYVLGRRDDVPADLEDAPYDYGLYLIQKSLVLLGKSLHDFGLPSPVHDWGLAEGNRLLQQEYAYDQGSEAAEADRAIGQFNDGQRRCFDQILHNIQHDPENAHFFLQGPGGTGKTFLYTALCHYLRGQGKVVLCVASSGTPIPYSPTFG
jgi:PIF1-like helicase